MGRDAQLGVAAKKGDIRAIIGKEAGKRVTVHLKQRIKVATGRLNQII
jgi:hypothetical protein